MDRLNELIRIIELKGGKATFEEICEEYSKRNRIALSSNHKALLKGELLTDNRAAYENGYWVLNGYISNAKKPDKPAVSVKSTNREWILSANPKMFDHEKAFNKKGYIDWRQYNNYEIGDIVYIYASKHIHRINAVAKVTKINMNRDEADTDEAEFWADGVIDNAGIKRFFRLELIKFIDDDRLELKELLNHGLKAAPQVACKVNNELYDYIHSVLD